MFTFSVLGYYTLDVYKVFADTKPTLDHEFYLTEVGSLSSIFGSLRFIWSAFLDHYSYKKVYGTLLVLQMVIATTYYFAAKSEVMFASWIWLTIWCEGGHFTIVPNILKIIYGKHATSLYGIMFFYTGLCNTLILVLMQTRLAHDYIIFWLICGGFSAISFFMLVTIFN